MTLNLNKQDLLPPEERDAIVANRRAHLVLVLKKYAEPAGIIWSIVDTPGFILIQRNSRMTLLKNSPRDVMQLEKERPMKLHDHRKTQHTAAEKAPSDEELRDGVEKAEIKDSNAFWTSFESAGLANWGHLAHLHAGHLVMLRGEQQSNGMLKSADTFLEHLTRLQEARTGILLQSSTFVSYFAPSHAKD